MNHGKHRILLRKDSTSPLILVIFVNCAQYFLWSYYNSKNGVKILGTG